MPPSRFEKFVSYTDNIRRLLITLFVVIAFFIVVPGLFFHYNKKQLLIYPLEIPEVLKQQGYTSQIATLLVLDHIHQIKAIGASYYSSQNIELPSWADGIDEYKEAIGNETFTQINGFIRFMFNKNIQTGTGEIVSPDNNTMKIDFRIGDDIMSVIKGKDQFNDIVDTTAEFVLEKLDPYELAGYYLLTGQRAKSLRICQLLLNSINKAKDKDDYALALMLRGSAYLELDFNPSPNNSKAQNILKEALTSVKRRNPWLIYNNLAVAYYYQKNWQEADRMYRKSLNADSTEFGNNMNYGNLLRTEYEVGFQKSRRQIDSAIVYYNKAISYKKTDSRPYINLIFGLYDAGKKVDAEETITKVREMNPNDSVMYYAIAQKQEQLHMNQAAITNYVLAGSTYHNLKLKKTIKDKIDSLAKLNVTPKKNQ